VIEQFVVYWLEGVLCVGCFCGFCGYLCMCVDVVEWEVVLYVVQVVVEGCE